MPFYFLISHLIFQFFSLLCWLSPSLSFKIYLLYELILSYSIYNHGWLQSLFTYWYPNIYYFQLRLLWASDPNTQLSTSHFFQMPQKLFKFNILQMEFIILLQTRSSRSDLYFSAWYYYPPLPTPPQPVILVQILEVIFNTISSPKPSPSLVDSTSLMSLESSLLLSLPKSLSLNWILAINQLPGDWVCYGLKLRVL